LRAYTKAKFRERLQSEVGATPLTPVPVSFGSAEYPLVFDVAEILRYTSKASIAFSSSLQPVRNQPGWKTNDS